MPPAVLIRTVKLATANANLLYSKDCVHSHPWELHALKIILVLLDPVYLALVQRSLLALAASQPLNAAVTLSARGLINRMRYIANQWWL